MSDPDDYPMVCYGCKHLLPWAREFAEEELSDATCSQAEPYNEAWSYLVSAGAMRACAARVSLSEGLASQPVDLSTLEARRAQIRSATAEDLARRAALRRDRRVLASSTADIDREQGDG